MHNKMLFVEVLMSPSCGGFLSPLLIWHASIGLGPLLSTGLKSSTQKPNESSQRTQTKDKQNKQETLGSLEPVIVLNMSINPCSLLESPFSLGLKLMPTRENESVLRLLRYYIHVLVCVYKSPFILLQQSWNILHSAFCSGRWHEEQWVRPCWSPRSLHVEV